jgi:hypothetical protein
LYVDTYYTDGTKLYGRRHDFQTGTTDWALGEVYIEPAKPIHYVSVHCLLRGKSGTAWFDDLALFEDPLRKGNLATLANVETDSCYERYDPSPLNDGVTQVAGLHWSRESWASAEIESEHFAVLRFDAPKTVAMAVIHWSLDAGIPRTSAEVQIQVQDGDGWRSVATAKPDGPTPRTEIILDPPATASAFMFLQPPGKGPAGRPHLMWVREIELIPGP